MPRRGLAFAVVFALALPLASCVSPEELRREDEATYRDRQPQGEKLERLGSEMSG
jgi:hypothetical protein